MNEILETLNERNGARDPDNAIIYKQLFNFHYADGAKMLTVGGLLFDKGQSPQVSLCDFETLPFIRSDDDSYRIEVPCLTYKEIRHLDEQLPVDDCAKLDAHAIPVRDLRKYGRVYRYFPTFAEAEV